MVGDFGVGKTSLIRRFVERQFSDQYLSTVGVKISQKQISLPVNPEQKIQNLQLMIWDLEGHTKFKTIAPSYLRGSSGAIIVADVTRQETMERLEEHIKLFLSINSQGFIIIAFNKSDLFDEEKVAQLLTTYNFSEQPRVISTYATSAKTGKDVDLIFEKLAYKIVFPE
ncbi:GTP-binding protein [[Phormidium ambiguum] IAM M-71]|uniref:GTP-binding protein n=1 Tax=[Phormidium ambiguum] IAM M-71 TaxID=454136 RepID=A0A1U7IEW8_9CYAN|nr:GTP-binding protein [Phormidium ambiguum IAM M-71]